MAKQEQKKKPGTKHDLMIAGHIDHHNKGKVDEEEGSQGGTSVTPNLLDLKKGAVAEKSFAQRGNSGKPTKKKGKKTPYRRGRLSSQRLRTQKLPSASPCAPPREFC